MATKETRKGLALAQLHVAEPCHELWDGMTPIDASRRHCDSCSKAVNDLSTMSRVQAERLITKPGEPPCVRFARDANGRVMTREDFRRIKRRANRGNWLRRAAAIAATLGLGSLFNLGCDRESVGSPPLAGRPAIPAIASKASGQTTVGEATMIQGDAMPATQPATQPSAPPYTHTAGVIATPPPKSPPRPPSTIGKVAPAKHLARR